ncbi:hypothetical protein, partial [Salmonella enterica]|uniref:hypothetical protein n=1 Tax=Salmonella enterica TaxID=28901 RepID=UPI001653F1B9
ELDEFKRLLKSQDSFINNPDADAKARGFPDRKTELDIAENAKDRKSQETLAKDQQAAALAQARNKPTPATKPPA